MVPRPVSAVSVVVVVALDVVVAGWQKYQEGRPENWMNRGSC